MGFPGGSVGKDSAFNAGDSLQQRRPRFNPWVRKIPWRSKWQPTLVFLPGKSHGQRGAWWATVHGVTRVGHNLVTKPQLQLYHTTYANNSYS